MARRDREHSGVMSEVGKEIRRRRRRLFGPGGTELTQAQLADEAGVNRDTIGAIETGKGFTQRTLTAIETALERLEAEAGLDIPAASEDDGEGVSVWEFEVKGVGDATVVVRGPVHDAAELEESVIRILRRMRQQEGNETDAG